MSAENKPHKDKANIYNEILIKGQVYKDVLSKKELWEKVADIHSGEFRIKQTISKDMSLFKLQIHYKNQNIVLTESDSKPLKIEIELRLNSEFEFNISWEDGIDRLLKVLGKQDIEIGNIEFDKKYLIQSNNRSLVLKLFNFEQIPQAILKQNIYLINLEYSSKNKLHKLIIVKDRNTQEVEVMLGLVNLQFAIIDFFIKERLLQNIKII